MGLQLNTFIYFMTSKQIFFFLSFSNVLNVTWFQPLDKVSWIKWGKLPGQAQLELSRRLIFQELTDLGRERKMSMALMTEMEAAGKGYAKEAMRKWGHGTWSSGQLSKPVHFHVKRRERCGLITSHVLRTWAKLGTEFSDLPLWTHFFCFLQLLWVPVFMLRAKTKDIFYIFF